MPRIKRMISDFLGEILMTREERQRDPLMRFLLVLVGIISVLVALGILH